LLGPRDLDASGCCQSTR